MRILLFPLMIGTLSAVDIAGVTFPGQVQVGTVTVPLRGTAVQKYKVFWTVHATGWWQDPATAILADTPMVLELHYFHDIPAKGFREATDEGFKRGCSTAEYTALTAGLAAWNAAYIDINAGDRYRITYAPQVGTTLVKGGRDLVTVPGHDFAQAMFGIWLGPKPVEVGHRKDLLDGK